MSEPYRTAADPARCMLFGSEFGPWVPREKFSHGRFQPILKPRAGPIEPAPTSACASVTLQTAVYLGSLNLFLAPAGGILLLPQAQLGARCWPSSPKHTHRWGGVRGSPSARLCSLPSEMSTQFISTWGNISSSPDTGSCFLFKVACSQLTQKSGEW